MAPGPRPRPAGGPAGGELAVADGVVSGWPPFAPSPPAQAAAAGSTSSAKREPMIIASLRSNIKPPPSGSLHDSPGASDGTMAGLPRHQARLLSCPPARAWQRPTAHTKYHRSHPRLLACWDARIERVNGKYVCRRYDIIRG